MTTQHEALWRHGRSLFPVTTLKYKVSLNEHLTARTNLNWI